MIGMPPPTLASYSRSTLCSRADGQQLGAVLRHHFLVRRHDELARRERVAQVAVRRLLAAHDFDDQLDVGIVDQVARVGGEQ